MILITGQWFNRETQRKYTLIVPVTANESRMEYGTAKSVRALWKEGDMVTKVAMNAIR
jgi:hypothetical protein|tara:strand:+ start:522 stop:695 length:174 start_codon:yes stop_codon:yes gene_type:complete